MPKTSLRRTLLRCRGEMEPGAWRQASRSAQERLLNLDLFAQAGCIALYAPIRNEIDTALLHAEAIRNGKRVFYPRICGEEMLFAEVTDRTPLEPGAFGIPEPCAVGRGYPADIADLLVIPGVAFDHVGHRIGFGKGYYDRCLARLSRPVALVGLCHDFQLLERLPAEGHDIRMQYVVTDQRLIDSRNRPSERPDDHIGGGQKT